MASDKSKTWLVTIRRNGDISEETQSQFDQFCARASRYIRCFEYPLGKKEGLHAHAYLEFDGTRDRKTVRAWMKTLIKLPDGALANRFYNTKIANDAGAIGYVVKAGAWKTHGITAEEIETGTALYKKKQESGLTAQQTKNAERFRQDCNKVAAFLHPNYDATSDKYNTAIRVISTHRLFTNRSFTYIHTVARALATLGTAYYAPDPPAPVSPQGPE